MFPERHNKVWGHEDWIANTPEYCGKRLWLNKGFRCSLHFHKDKDEVFFIESGKVLMEADGEITTMFPGDRIHIDPLTMHRFSGLEDSVIFEFSTHHEESDSYRVSGELSGPIPGN